METKTILNFFEGTFIWRQFGISIFFPLEMALIGVKTLPNSVLQSLCRSNSLIVSLRLKRKDKFALFYDPHLLLLQLLHLLLLSFCLLLPLFISLVLAFAVALVLVALAIVFFSCSCFRCSSLDPDLSLLSLCLRLACSCCRMRRLCPFQIMMKTNE